MHDFVTHAEQQRPNSLQIDGFSADPEGEFRLSCDRSGAGYWGIHKTDLSRHCGPSHSFRERRIYRAAINPERVRFKMLQESISTGRGLFDRVRMGQHGKKDIYLLGELGWRIGKRSAGTKQRFRFAASAIEHDKSVTVLLQIRRHAAANDA
jgi:hypothetical protein